MTSLINEFMVCPENFFRIATFAGTNATCKHLEFTTETSSPNVKGQYKYTRTCTNCGAYRIYALYAKVARKVGRK